MITLAQGNLLEADAEALVNTVNTVGVMGKGIALQFKRAYPGNFRAYKSACDAGRVVVGEMFVFETGTLGNPRYIINFPTKRHWKGGSRMADIEAGLENLADTVTARGIRSVALPPLGCGNGGLDWSEVFPRIRAVLAPLPDVEFLVYAPAGAPAAGATPGGTLRPRMTPGRAAVLGLMSRYNAVGYRMSPLEVQKLVYFLQAAGETLPRIQFERDKYGPYADNIRHVLDRMEGHFLRGVDGGSSPTHTSIELLPGAVAEAEVFLDSQPETKARFDRVTRLIEGFETPYGMELLATVHWVAVREDMLARSDVNAAIAGVHAWNARKRKTFSPGHITVAWDRLRQQEWL